MNIQTRFNVYLGKNLFGVASKFQGPDIESATVEIKNGIGTYNLPVGINAMSASLTLISFDKDVFSKVANPFAEINFTVYQSLDSFSNENLTKSESVKVVLRGSSSKFPLLGELEQQTNVEETLEFNISSAKKYIGSKEIYHVDIPNLIWKVNGVDLSAQLKKNLGLV